MNTIYVGIDDTDQKEYHLGTGKLARMVAARLKADISDVVFYDVMRHQLLIDPRIHYTSHNSPACISLVIDPQSGENPQAIKEHVSDIARSMIVEKCAPKANPGLCVAYAEEVTKDCGDFGFLAAREVLSKEQALAVSNDTGMTLQILGGNGEGIIGALASVGLNKAGNAGRYLEFNGILRDFNGTVEISELEKAGLACVCIDRKADPVLPNDNILMDTWPRPRRIHGKPVVFLTQKEGHWKFYDTKGKKENGVDQNHD